MDVPMSGGTPIIEGDIPYTKVYGDGTIAGTIKDTSWYRTFYVCSDDAVAICSHEYCSDCMSEELN